MIQTVSMNGWWQPRGITKYTSKNKPSRVRMGKANLPLQRTPSKEMDLEKDSDGQTKEGGWDTHQPNQHRSTQTPWTLAQQSKRQQLRRKNRNTMTKDNALNAPRGGTSPGSVLTNRAMPRLRPLSK